MIRRAAIARTTADDIPDIEHLQHLTRRHFFRRARSGLGAIALASLLAKDAPARRRRASRRQPARPAAAALRRQGQARHLPAHDRLAAAPRPVRLQAGAGQAQRPALPRRVPQGQAVRLHLRRAQAARHAAEVRAARQGRRLDVRRAPAPARRSPTSCASSSR